jgi:predicted PurR-regulated permease PerM
MNPQASPDITRITFVVLIIGLLLAASLWTMAPFLGALVWAAAIVIATWPLLLWVQRHVGGRRSIATAVMTLVMLVIFIVPYWAAVGVLLDASAEGLEVAKAYLANGLGPPPAWIAGIPWVGGRIAGKWQELAAGGPEALAEAIRPHARAIAAWILAITGGFGGVFLQFLLTVIIAAVLYAQGEVAAKGVLAFARRIGAERGEQTVRLAGQAVQGVAMGVVVTAIVQTALVGLGLWVAGVPYPGLLTAIVFVLCIAQLGPFPVLIPAMIWMFSNASVGWASVFLIYSVPVGILDNFLRPILISRGVELPLLLIIAGVIGGLIGFGVIGLFIGPVILAATYTLLQSWVGDDKEAAR